MIGNGAIKAGLAIRDGMVGFKIAIEGSFESSTSSSSVEGKYTLTLETYIHRDQVPKTPMIQFINLLLNQIPCLQSILEKLQQPLLSDCS